MALSPRSHQPSHRLRLLILSHACRLTNSPALDMVFSIELYLRCAFRGRNISLEQNFRDVRKLEITFSIDNSVVIFEIDFFQVDNINNHWEVEPVRNAFFHYHMILFLVKWQDVAFKTFAEQGRDICQWKQQLQASSRMMSSTTICALAVTQVPQEAFTYPQNLFEVRYSRSVFGWIQSHTKSKGIQAPHFGTTVYNFPAINERSQSLCYRQVKPIFEDIIRTLGQHITTHLPSNSSFTNDPLPPLSLTPRAFMLQELKYITVSGTLLTPPSLAERVFLDRFGLDSFF